MLPFFRRIRKKLADEKQILKYSRYAIGEIVLVVIGILIALQINNWNEDQKSRKKELTYLENIRADLMMNIDELNIFIDSRNSCIASCDILLDYYNEKKELDLQEFNSNALNVMIWFPFIQHDNTYQELLNSGNLAMISNKHIKTGMQDMQVGFSNVAFIEGEMQQDYESYLYDNYFNIADLDANFKVYQAHLENKQNADPGSISSDEVQTLLQNMAFKNGITLAKYNSDLLVAEYQKMIETTRELIAMIDIEIQ
jgi:hypothetical protein